MQVDAFRENIGRDENAIIVAGFSGVGVEVRNHCTTKLRARCRAEKQGLCFHFLFDPFRQIFRSVPEFGKNNQLARLKCR